MMKYLALGLAAALCGCQSQMRILEAGGDIRAEPSTVAGSDYVVHMRNTVDFGFNPDVKANRDKWALGMMNAQCPAGRIVNESVFATGAYLGGRPSRVYSIYIKCAG